MSKSKSDLLKLLNAVEPKVLKGTAGLYYKFADCMSSNAEPVELYFKPKFVRDRWLAKGDNLVSIYWLEINVLWVGPTSFPDLENGWAPSRLGAYLTKTGAQLQGVLMGKMFMPMGEFNENMLGMHEWASEHAADIQKYLIKEFLTQVSGTMYMDLNVIFSHMVEGMTKDRLEIKTTRVYLNGEYKSAQKEFSDKAKAKYESLTGDDPESSEE